LGTYIWIMQPALDKRIERNVGGCEGELCVVQNADLHRCFTDNDQGLKTWFKKD